MLMRVNLVLQVINVDWNVFNDKMKKLVKMHRFSFDLFDRKDFSSKLICRNGDLQIGCRTFVCERGKVFFVNIQLTKIWHFLSSLI